MVTHSRSLQAFTSPQVLQALIRPSSGSAEHPGYRKRGSAAPGWRAPHSTTQDGLLASAFMTKSVGVSAPIAAPSMLFDGPAGSQQTVLQGRGGVGVGRSRGQQGIDEIDAGDQAVGACAARTRRTRRDQVDIGEVAGLARVEGTAEQTGAIRVAQTRGEAADSERSRCRCQRPLSRTKLAALANHGVDPLVQGRTQGQFDVAGRRRR